MGPTTKIAWKNELDTSQKRLQQTHKAWGKKREVLTKVVVEWLRPKSIKSMVGAKCPMETKLVTQIQTLLYNPP